MKRLLTVLSLILYANLIFAVSVRISPIKKGKIVEKYDFSGEIKPFVETFVTPDVRGIVNCILVENGKKVKKGDVLITIDDERFRNAVEQSRAVVKINRAIENDALKDYKRGKLLYKKKVINEKSFDKFETLWIQAKARTSQAVSAYNLAKINLKKCKVRALIDGYFTNKNVYLGQSVSSVNVLGKVIDLKKVFVEVKIPENFIKFIKPNLNCMILGNYKAKVSYIDLYADNSRAFLVKMIMDNHENRFKANMFVKGRIILNSYENVPIIPIKSIVTKGEKKYIFIAKDGKAIQKQVELIAQDGMYCYCKNVEIGQSLIVVGQYGLSSGAAIEIVK